MGGRQLLAVRPTLRDHDRRTSRGCDFGDGVLSGMGNDDICLTEQGPGIVDP
jgi:hypothetical protein